MTQNEHKLMVYMFARELMLIESLIEILKSRGILQSDDVDAFEEFVRARESSSRDAFHAVVNQYTAFAQELGIQGDLPHV